MRILFIGYFATLRFAQYDEMFGLPRKFYEFAGFVGESRNDEKVRLLRATIHTRNDDSAQIRLQKHHNLVSRGFLLKFHSTNITEFQKCCNLGL